MATFNMPHLMGLFNNASWMLKSETLDTMGEILKQKINTGSITEYLALANTPLDQSPAKIEFLPQIRTAVLGISGTMVAQATGIDALCGFASTLEMTSAFTQLDKDPNLDRIVLHVRSGGGEVTGGFEFAEAVNNSQKQVITFSDTMIGSLAYLVGSAADRLIVAPTTEVGSIGVRTSIIKIRPEDQKADIHTFSSGDKKTFGDPNIPITEAEKEFFQNRVDNLFNEFAAAVSVFRDWDIQSIRETQAGSDKAMLMPSNQRFFDEIMTGETFKERLLNGTL